MIKTSSDLLIDINGLSKIYQTDEVETHAVSGVSIGVRRGEFVAIAGPSGCGKSTLLSLLGLLDMPSAGSYFLNGVDTTRLRSSELAAHRRKTIGFIFQSFNLIGDLSVIDNVALPLTFRKEVRSSQRIEMAKAALAVVGMGHRFNHLPHQLSGGQQQRVAIARALVSDPPILLADEPTGNLDSQNGNAVMSLLSKLHSSGSTIIMVTHDQNHAAAADRQVTMLDGRIVT